MPHCTKCGAEYGEGVAFCPKCGQPTGAAAGSPARAGGVESNVAAALAYLWFIAILWLILEPYNKDRFIRFHSFQAIAFGVVAFVVSVILGFLPFMNLLLVPLWSIVVFLVWLFCLYKAFMKEWFKLPVIGDFAEKQAGPAQ